MFSPRFFESNETLELFETFWRDSMEKGGLEDRVSLHESFQFPGNDLSLPLNDSNLSLDVN